MAPPPFHDYGGHLDYGFIVASVGVIDSTPRIFLSAGEASGEHYGASLIQADSQTRSRCDILRAGRPAHGSSRTRTIVRAEDVAVMGITEVIRHMPRIYGEYRKLKRSLSSLSRSCRMPPCSSTFPMSTLASPANSTACAFR